MAEFVGLAAAITQLVDLSGTLLAGGYGFLAKVARAPSEIRALLTEAAAINSLLGRFQVIADASPNTNQSDALKSLEQLGVLRDCFAALKSVEKALKTCEQVQGQDVRNIGKKLLWPFKEKETKEALQKLRHLRGLLTDALQVNTAASLLHIEANQDVLLEEMNIVSAHIQAHVAEDKAHKVITWICPSPTTDAYVTLQQALSRRLPGTGKWFLDSSMLNDFVLSESSTIWMTGLPGSGKTMLCSSVIERILQDVVLPALALYFFCDHRDRSRTTYESFLTAIIHQALNISPPCLKHAEKLYDEQVKLGMHPLDPAGFVALVEAFLSHIPELFIILDALDECSESSQIAETLAGLQRSARRTGTKLKIFFTSRFDIRIEQRFPDLTRLRVVLAENMRQDIDQYVEAELQSRVTSGRLKLRDRDTLLPMIRQQVSACAGTVLQAQLQIDVFSTAKTDKEVKRMMRSLPDGLDYTYQALLCQAALRYPDQMEDMKRLLRCLVTSASPLTATQLAEIMAMQPGSRRLDFDTVATDPYDVLEPIASLVVISREGQKEGVVKLSHYSLEEYLCSDSIRQGPAKSFFIDYNEADAWLASICLQYLTFDIFNTLLDQDLDSDTVALYTFRGYAALNWYKHIRITEDQPHLLQICSPYLYQFLDHFEGPPCYNRWQDCIVDTEHYYRHLSYSPIGFCIWASLNTIAKNLISQLSNLDAYSVDGNTCLTVAAYKNNVDMIVYLANRGASIDLPTYEPNHVCALTPLHIAAERSSREAFDLLLGLGADPHKPSTSGATPFYRACRGGDLYIVKKLKELGCDINVQTWRTSWTPLMEAVTTNSEEVVDLLLEWGADLCVVTSEGATALAFAEFVGNESIVRKLRAALALRSADET